MSLPLYASADFTDSDAGAGDSSIENLGEFIKIDDAIKNLLDATSNKVEQGTDTYIISIRDYRNSLQKLCCLENLKLLEKFYDPKFEECTVNSILELGSILENENFNPSSSDIFKKLLIDLSGSNTDINTELGCEFTIVEGAISKLNSLYLDSLDNLFSADKNLNSALEGVRYTFNKVNTLLSLEMNEATADMYHALSKYIHTTIGKYNLKDLFDEFIKARRKFIHYRILLNAKDVINEENKPMCTICLDKDVNYVLVGCGHTFCTECTRKQINSCYICRCKIRERIKIYFS